MPVLYEKRGHVAIVTLSRPEARNCWGPDYDAELPRLCEEMTDDDAVRVIVLTGDEAGAAFSAGANLRSPTAHTNPSTADFIRSLPQKRRFPGQLLADCPKPVIAAVNGYAIGIGCILSCCADLIVASDKAEWRLSQVALGILPSHAGIPRLARWIGKGNAMKVGLGYPLKAEEAYRQGLAQWLVPHAELMERVMEIADRLAHMPPLAVSLAKESLNRGLDVPIAEAAYADQYRQMALMQTEDVTETHAAWREKRPPEVKGR